MTSIDTIGALIDGGYRLTIHCHNQQCRHYVELDLEALAERLGRAFVTVGKPNPLAARMVCSQCSGKDLGLILIPTTPYDRVVSQGPTYGPRRVGLAPAARRARRRVRL